MTITRRDLHIGGTVALIITVGDILELLMFGCGVSFVAVMAFAFGGYIERTR